MSLRIKTTAVYYYAFILLGLTFALLGPTIEVLAGNASVSIADASILFTAYSLGYLGGSLISGRLYDRMRGHPVVAACLMLVAVLLALMPSLRSLLVLCVGQFLLGIVASGIDVGLNALLVWVHGRSVGPFMNALHLMFGVGSLVAPLLIAAVVGFQWAYWIVAIAMLPAVVLFLRLPSPIHEKHVGDTRGGTFANPLLIILVVTFFFLIVAGEGGMSSWLFTYARKGGLDEKTSALVTATFWGAFTFGRLLSIPLAVRVPAARILLVSTVLCISGTVVMASFGDLNAAMWGGAALIGLGVASLFAMMIAYVETRMVITGVTTSLFLVGASLGGIVVPLLIGRTIESFGRIIVPVVICVCMVLALLVLLAVFRLGKTADR
ncbi:MAG: MFS transporter [Chloroflexi bacterium]|nr:MFS transporter [Chloroflexota bacterium]